MARITHPDKVSGEEAKAEAAKKFHDVAEAYEVRRGSEDTNVPKSLYLLPDGDLIVLLNHLPMLLNVSNVKWTVLFGS